MVPSQDPALPFLRCIDDFFLSAFASEFARHAHALRAARFPAVSSILGIVCKGCGQSGVRGQIGFRKSQNEKGWADTVLEALKLDAHVLILLL